MEWSEQLGERRSERLRQTADVDQGRIPLAALDAGNFQRRNVAIGPG